MTTSWGPKNGPVPGWPVNGYDAVRQEFPHHGSSPQCSVPTLKWDPSQAGGPHPPCSTVTWPPARLKTTSRVCYDSSRWRYGRTTGGKHEEGSDHERKAAAMSRIVYCALLGIALVCPTPADEIRADSPHVWEKVEITLQSQRQYDNPYTDVQVWVDLKGPNFDKRCYGFWDGGSTFRVRVLATAPGRWTWRSGSNVADPGLQGVRGAFTAVAWTETELEKNPCRRGMIRPSRNGHAFEYRRRHAVLPAGRYLVGHAHVPLSLVRRRHAAAAGTHSRLQGLRALPPHQQFNCIAMIAAFPNWANDGKPARWKTQDGMILRSAWPQAGTESAKEMTDEAGPTGVSLPRHRARLRKVLPRPQSHQSRVLPVAGQEESTT